ncbi:MAG: hypothetical protein F4Y67_02150 [Chloroflexi bacterium]|nr:hypothetical protein [Chloroflexota bacterium]
MREINLVEYQPSEYDLSPQELDALLCINIQGLLVEPIEAQEGRFRLTPGPTVGAVETAKLSVLISPKIGIAQLLAISCYAHSRYRQIGEFKFPESRSLHDALALALTRAAREACGSGVLRGYRAQEDELLTVRGRIKFTEQLRRRFGPEPPVAVGFDEYTEDILLNRLIAAAAHRLGRFRLRSKTARAGLAWIAGTLQNVSLVEFPDRQIPEIRFGQLNKHYRPAVTLSKLILRYTGFEADRGDVKAGGFLINMNKLFQDFVFEGMREQLARTGLRPHADRKLPTQLALDEDCRVSLMPDLSCWDRGQCTFVGDIKYKNLTGEKVPAADIYQVLAYTTAANLSHGLLVYALGEAASRSYRIRNAGKVIRVTALDLSKPLDEILIDIGYIAKTVAELRRSAA